MNLSICAHCAQQAQPVIHRNKRLKHLLLNQLVLLLDALLSAVIILCLLISTIVFLTML